MKTALKLAGSASIGGTPIFSDISLTVERGKWTCLLGASGVGKSTILRLFAGLADGVQINGDLQAPERVALMAQQDLLLPWLNVLDNVLIGARLRGEKPDHNKALQTLAKVGLGEHAERRPSALSGGQRQRVALVRTLMEGCETVLLDEPFSALDALTRAQMQDLAADMLRDRTVLLVTHDPGEAARMGHKIVILTRDQLLDIPTPSGGVPRPVEQPDVLMVQSRLLTTLRDAA
ncbi:ABC transporter ATP-binding protein [Pontivivens insulae]|uniref:ABC transporter ATP-binding protein n=1 Tax=Pontivivens insulae TaxID=1639689 RepID=UPI000D554B99|nr:ABC transporter ATP-binding protein [Pontivivens insulae]